MIIIIVKVGYKLTYNRQQFKYSVVFSYNIQLYYNHSNAIVQAVWIKANSFPLIYTFEYKYRIARKRVSAEFDLSIPILFGFFNF